MRILKASLAVCLVLALSGCGDIERPNYIQLGKDCADAGGSWTWSEWSGYHCEFNGGATN